MVAANGHQVGVRTDGRATTRRLISEPGWQPIEVPFTQADLSIDLGSQSDARRPIVSLWHGERSMVRSHDPGRIVSAAGRWLSDLSSPQPTEPFLPNANAALLPTGEIVVTPRWLTGDTALLERFVPDGTIWLDGCYVGLEPHGNGVGVVDASSTSFGPVTGFVLDRGHRDPNLSPPGRRTAELIGRVGGDDPETRFELASDDVQMVAVNTEDQRRACLAARPLFSLPD